MTAGYLTHDERQELVRLEQMYAHKEHWRLLTSYCHEGVRLYAPARSGQLVEISICSHEVKAETVEAAVQRMAFHVIKEARAGRLGC